jgi:hypothetical protein
MLKRLRNIPLGTALIRKSNNEHCPFRGEMKINNSNYFCFDGFIVNKDIMSRFFKVVDEGDFGIYYVVKDD